MDAIPVVKGHAYGNDFLLVPETAVGADRRALARAMCDRHHGIGGDGLIVHGRPGGGVTMDLYNADGSPSELSGNGLRCLAALVAREQGLAPGAAVAVETGAGRKTLDLLACEGTRYTFRAALGPPGGIRQETLEAAGETVTATLLSMGNPQCVVLGPLPDEARFHRLGAALAVHPAFPAGTNVEFVSVDAPDHVRILIWERGVGPTTASGTGASASAVAAVAHGGADRAIDVESPGGTQRVEWREDGVHLTGWADLVLDGRWLPGPAAS